jgi:hypothetical protein
MAYHRYGTVLVLDGFEDGINGWTKVRNGTSSDVVASVTQSYQGKTACKLVSGTGITPNASIGKYLPPVDECNTAIQLTLGIDTNLVRFEVALTYGKAPYVYYFRIRYTHATGVLAYYDVGGSYVDFADCGVLWDQGANWHNLKLVIDTEDKEYVRCYLDNVNYSMADLTPNKASWTLGAFLGPVVQVVGALATSTTMYIDNVIVTFNEF